MADARASDMAVEDTWAEMPLGQVVGVCFFVLGLAIFYILTVLLMLNLLSICACTTSNALVHD